MTMQGKLSTTTRVALLLCFEAVAADDAKRGGGDKGNSGAGECAVVPIGCHERGPNCGKPVPLA